MEKKTTLKGQFIRTGLAMLIISLLMGLLVCVAMLAVFCTKSPEGGLALWMMFQSIFTGEAVGGPRTLLPYFLLGGLLLCLAVGTVCVLLTSRLAARVSAPVQTLRQAADRLQAGELDFEVLSCEYQELDELCRAIESARKRLKESRDAEETAQKERELFMANLSHDLRTPVTTIKGYVEGLRDGIASTPEKQKHYLDTIYAKSLVMEKLVQEMRDLSEYSMGRMQYQFEYVELLSFLRDVAEEYQIESELNGLQFSALLPEENCIATADRNKLKRVLDNLFSNAVKYNKLGGSIHLTAERYQGGLVIQLSDNGKGIESEALHHVFDRFFREDAARTSAVPGSGLGLAICKSIVESHHGKIWLTSERGEGTTAFLYLPLAKENLPDREV